MSAASILKLKDSEDHKSQDKRIASYHKLEVAEFECSLEVAMQAVIW